MTRLHNGKVIAVVAPPQMNEQPRRVAIYDPVTDMWRETAPLNYARSDSTSILLNDGRLLIVGGTRIEPGVNTPLPVPQPEIFDPATEKWTEVQIDTSSAEFVNMWLRSSFSYLPSGKVLALSNIYNKAYFFDPETGSIRRANSSPQNPIGNTNPSSIILRDGRVLFVSNESSLGVKPSAEVFDPDAESWTTVELPENIGSPSPKILAGILPDGKALGLFTLSNGLRISARFDPATGKWIDPAAHYSQFPYAVTLTSGEVLAYRDNAAEIYNPSSKSWRTINSPAKSNSPAVLLASGQVYTGKELYGVDFGSTVTPTAVNTSAASFRVEPLARGSIASVFGSNLSGVIWIKDQTDVEHPVTQIFTSTPDQINYLLPDNIPTGQAEMFIGNQRALLSVVDVAPGIFTANSSGKGIPAAVAYRVLAGGETTYEPITDGIDVSKGVVFLVLFGTGWRHRTSTENVQVYIGGYQMFPQFVGAAGGFIGLDQINVGIAPTFAGKGEVDVIVTVDGKTANPVKIKFK